MKDIQLTGKMQDGTEVVIRKDATHFRAYNKENAAIGQPLMNLDYLLAYLGITLDGLQGEAKEVYLEANKPAEKKVGEAEAGDKRYEITHDGHHYRAQPMQGPAGTLPPPCMDMDTLLNSIGATSCTLSDPETMAPKSETKAAQEETPAAGNETKAAPEETPATKEDQLPLEAQAGEAPAGATVPAGLPAAPPVDVTAAPPADVTECGQHKAGECKMDGVACDGQCGEHAQRAKKQKDAAESKKEEKAPEISRKRVK